MKTLLLLGSDAASSWLGREVEKENIEGVHVYKDGSSNIQRVLSLLLKRRLSVSVLLKLFFADKLRQKKTFKFDGNVESNAGLLSLISELAPDRVLCFRCGLIINGAILATGVPLFNIHVSSLPEFPGLGAVERAIKAGAWEQHACLHYIDKGIDTGVVLFRQKYMMNPGAAYWENENVAYLAGVELAIRFLRQEAGL